MKPSVYKLIYLISLSFFSITTFARSENVIMWADLIGDTFINDSSKDENYGSNTGLMVGTLSNGGTLITRILFNNNLEGTGATINSATLKLYRNNGSGSFTLDVKCASKQWHESTLIWNTEGSASAFLSPKTPHLIPE